MCVGVLPRAILRHGLVDTALPVELRGEVLSEITPLHVSTEGYLPSGRVQHTRKDPQKSRLARTIGTDQCDTITAADGHLHI